MSDLGYTSGYRDGFHDGQRAAFERAAKVVEDFSSGCAKTCRAPECQVARQFVHDIRALRPEPPTG